MSGPAFVVAEQVWAGYGAGSARTEVLQGLSLEVGRGERAAVVGPSGSGKTTLLSLLGGLDRPSRGRVLVGGQDLGALDDAALLLFRRACVGFVFQLFHLLPTLDARENVEAALVPLRTPRPERQRRATEALARVGLAGKERRRPHELSGGEQQRVALARAWVKAPVLLLADEPTGNLDAHAAGEVAALLMDPTLGGSDMTVVVATHDPAVARRTGRTFDLGSRRPMGAG